QRASDSTCRQGSPFWNCNFFSRHNTELNCSAMRIKRYEPGEGAQLNAIFCGAILRTARRGYSEQQVRVWAAQAADAHEYDERAADGRLLLVAVDEQNKPIAYGDL